MLLLFCLCGGRRFCLTSRIGQAHVFWSTQDRVSECDGDDRFESCGRHSITTEGANHLAELLSGTGAALTAPGGLDPGADPPACRSSLSTWWCVDPFSRETDETQNHMGSPAPPRAEFMAFYGIFFTCKLRSDSEKGITPFSFFLAKVNDFLEKNWNSDCVSKTKGRTWFRAFEKHLIDFYCWW